MIRQRVRVDEIGERVRRVRRRLLVYAERPDHAQSIGELQNFPRPGGLAPRRIGSGSVLDSRPHVSRAAERAALPGWNAHAVVHVSVSHERGKGRDEVRSVDDANGVRDGAIESPDEGSVADARRAVIVHGDGARARARGDGLGELRGEEGGERAAEAVSGDEDVPAVGVARRRAQAPAFALVERARART